MRGFEDIGSKGHFSAKKVFWGQPPLGGHKIFQVKITSKMNSAPSNYSECKFTAKSDNFTITIIGGIFNIFGGKKAPKGELEFFST